MIYAYPTTDWNILNMSENTLHKNYVIFCNRIGCETDVLTHITIWQNDNQRIP